VGGGEDGELTRRAVELGEEDAEDDFTTELRLSAGGVPRVATEGLTWESTIYWDWDGPCCGESGGSTHVP
jgi:hypothetical protein